MRERSLPSQDWWDPPAVHRTAGATRTGDADAASASASAAGLMICASGHDCTADDSVARSLTDDLIYFGAGTAPAN